MSFESLPSLGSPAAFDPSKGEKGPEKQNVISYKGISFSYTTTDREENLSKAQRFFQFLKAVNSAIKGLTNFNFEKAAKFWHEFKTGKRTIVTVNLGDTSAFSSKNLNHEVIQLIQSEMSKIFNFPSIEIRESGLSESLIQDDILKGKSLQSGSSIQKESPFYYDETMKKGRIKYPDGSVREGSFVSDHSVKGLEYPDITVGNLTCYFLILSNGSITYSDGRIEEGSFYYGSLDNLVGKLEKGKITYPDGTIEKGSFYGGKLFYGSILHPDGKIEEGSFYYGSYEESQEDIIGHLKNGKITYADGTIENIG